MNKYNFYYYCILRVLKKYFAAPQFKVSERQRLIIIVCYRSFICSIFNKKSSFLKQSYTSHKITFVSANS